MGLKDWHRLLWRRPRRQLFLCALLDFCGFILSALCASFLLSRSALLSEWSVAAIVGFIYLLLGWLFGSYTVLRWPWFTIKQVYQRVFITGFFTLLLSVFFAWITNEHLDLILDRRSVLLLTLVLESIWALFLRVIFRIIARTSQPLKWQLQEGSSAEILQILQECDLHPAHRALPFVHLELSSSRDSSSQVYSILDYWSPWILRRIDCIQQNMVRVPNVLRLAELTLERIPPSLLRDDWLEYEDIPWADPFSFQRQLKRSADVVLSLILLLLTSPLVLIFSALIWLEDRGPILFIQERSGWMGQAFRLYKLRTMHIQSKDVPLEKTVQDDKRITFVGKWLRRTRIDELPQLINVLRGEMSLIGPRPELPEFENELEARIHHYRKRHWMLPGLSGWAQVSAPYATTLEEAELKLSYDLFYIRHFSTSLDMLIFVNTIKTVLKSRGR